MSNLSEIWNCPDILKFQCPQKWESLNSTSDSNIRYCVVCSKNVHKCSTPREFAKHVKSGRCVAIPNRFAGRPENPTYVFGEPSQEIIETITQQEKLIVKFRHWWKMVLEIEPSLFQIFMQKTSIFEYYNNVYQGSPRGEKELAFELLELGQFEKVVDIAKSHPGEGFLRRLVEKLVSIEQLNVALEVASIFDTCNFKVLSLNLIATELARLGRIEQAASTFKMSVQTARSLTRARRKYEAEVFRAATLAGIAL